jgi:hypothetical protein
MRDILRASFDAVDVEVVGSIAVFTAAKPRPRLVS